MNTFTKLLFGAGLALASHQASAQQLLDNFETTRLVDYPSPQGTIAAVANPGSNGTNTSTTVGSFVRDGSQYSTISIQLKNSAKFASVAAYVAGTKRITLKFRSAAPAGTAVQLVLQNRAKAIATPYTYPQGNFSGVFNAITAATTANTWETLTFTYAAAPSDATVTATDIDQIAMLIAPNTTSTATYYFDDLMGPELSTTAAPVVTDQLYDNHEGTRVIKYKRNITGGGFKVDTLNPYKVTGNTTNNVFRYSRSTQQYDGIFIAPVGAPIADVSPFLTNAKQMTLRVYSPAVGTSFQITLQDSVRGRGTYPAGRHSEYLATTTTAGAWENLVFSFSNRPDATVTNTGVNELVILINSNTTQGLKLYLDDFTGPHLTNFALATRLSETTTAALAAPYPNPASGVVRLPISLQKAAVVSLSVYDNLGRQVAAVLTSQARPAGTFEAELNAAKLAPGLYTCRLTVDGQPLTRNLSIE